MKFQKADFSESTEALDNPGCGWYHLYSFNVQGRPEGALEAARGSLVAVGSKERLALVLIDIGAFRACEMPKEALLYIGRILKLFHDHKKEMILRFVYDTVGKGMEREPMELSLVERHMEQAGEIVFRYAEDILVLQGIFVGNWGEMHGSKFLDVPCMSRLLNSLNRAVKGSCFLAVRTPSQWRGIMEFPGTDRALRGRVALFNDGLFGSPTDLGTYGEEGSAAEKEGGLAGRKAELDWQSVYMENLPNGGEAVAGESLKGCREAAKEMAKLHLSYLNSVWQEKQLEYWKRERTEGEGCWDGLSGYDYIGRHLGYRFVIRDVKALSVKKLQIVVENCGFAGICEETECMLVIEKQDGSTVCGPVDVDARSFKSGQKIRFDVPLPDTECPEEGDRAYLKLLRKADAESLVFANQGAGDKVLLGTFEKKKFLDF